MVNHKTIELINSLKNKEKIRVLFVCLGNICRSPAAEGIMKSIISVNGADDRWIIDSAGTGGYHIGDLPDRRMRVHASHRGLSLDHVCRQISELDFSRFDIIVGMDDNNIHNLKSIAPTVDAEKKIVAMADFFSMPRCTDYVPDPYYEGADGFELVLDLLDDACNNLYNELK